MVRFRREVQRHMVSDTLCYFKTESDPVCTTWVNILEREAGTDTIGDALIVIVPGAETKAEAPRFFGTILRTRPVSVP